MCFPCGTFLQARRKWNQARAHESQSWPTAPGEVERSVKKTRVTGLPMKLFALELTYSYRVSGYTHQGNSVQFGAKYVAAEGLIEAQAQKYPAGAAVTVHYDPNDPATSVLETSDEMARQNSFQIWLYFLSPPVISAVVAMKNAVP